MSIDYKTTGLQNKTSSEIGTIIDEKEKALSEALTNHQTVEQEKLLLQREILEKQTQKKSLEITLSKSTHTIRQLGIELKILRNKFWSCKQSGT